MVNLRVAERQDVKNLPRRSFTVLKRSCNYQNGGSPMITLLQRMCWNRDCWRKPSGQGTDGGYPGESGFGHEEWNFQLEDAREGEVYGYLYYRPPQQTLNLSGGRFQIAFWALHPDSRQKLLVGFYHDAIPASRPDLEKLGRYFKKRRIYERRSAELVAAVPDLTFKQAMQHVHDSVGYLNFKCARERVEVLPGPIPLPKMLDGKHIGQYFTRPTILPAAITSDRLREIASDWRGVRKGGTAFDSPLAEDSYPRATAAALKTIIPLHNKLSNDFCSWLRSHGYREVDQEVDRVDVRFIDGNRRCLAELKICHTLTPTKAIREALGQLFEYNYYSPRDPADKWIMVLDKPPYETDQEYLRALTGRFRMPLAICWRSDAGFDLEDLETL